jgi:hypothetical protein
MTQEPPQQPKVESPRPSALAKRDRRLLTALSLPPLAWALHLGLAYGLVYPSLIWRTKAALAVLTAICQIVALLGAGLALRAGRLGRSAQSENAEQRARFLALAGASLGIFFAAVIVAQAVPIVILPLEQP